MGKIREGLKLMENREFKSTIPKKYKKGNSNRSIKTKLKQIHLDCLKILESDYRVNTPK